MNPIFVHRSRGTDHEVPGLWRYWCHVCDGPSQAGFELPGDAGDWGRFHLIHAHRFRALARRLNSQHGGRS